MDYYELFCRTNGVQLQDETRVLLQNRPFLPFPPAAAPEVFPANLLLQKRSFCGCNRCSDEGLQKMGNPRGLANMHGNPTQGLWLTLNTQKYKINRKHSSSNVETLPLSYPRNKFLFPTSHGAWYHFIKCNYEHYIHNVPSDFRRTKIATITCLLTHPVLQLMYSNDANLVKGVGFNPRWITLEKSRETCWKHTEILPVLEIGHIWIDKCKTARPVLKPGDNWQKHTADLFRSKGQKTARITAEDTQHSENQVEWRCLESKAQPKYYSYQWSFTRYHFCAGWQPRV